MANWKERFKNFKEKHGGTARSMTGGLKGSAMALASGGAAFYAAGYASLHVDFLRANWYALPAAMAVAGHVLKAKGHTDIGLALLGAAGALGVMGYLTNSGTTVGQGQQAQGFAIGDAGEAGALQSRDDAFRNLGEAGAYPALYATTLDQNLANAGGAGDAGMLVRNSISGLAA